MRGLRWAAQSRKKKERPKGPFYERLWFLGGALALLVLLIGWSVWPPGEDELFAEAKLLMASKDASDWREARRQYLEPLLRRFPEGQHAAAARGYVDQIEMHDAEVRMRRNLLLDKPPASTGEQLYGQARRYQEFGDSATALARYQTLISELKGVPQDRPFVLLARQQTARLRKQGPATDKAAFLEDFLAQTTGRLIDGIVRGDRHESGGRFSSGFGEGLGGCWITYNRLQIAPL